MKEALQYLMETYMPFHEIPGFEGTAIVVADSTSLKSLEQFQDAPNRIRARADLASSESFCEYINRFKGEESSIYLDVANGVFRAVLDHHGDDHPTWGDHTVSFSPKRSLEWLAWTAVHDKWLSQTDLGMLVERLLDTIHEPEPNKVLQAALDFQAVEKMVYGSAQNLDDGTVNFVFQKDNATKNVKFPHRIKLWMSVYENESKEFLNARIRYKTDGNGALAFKFSFIKEPEKVERDALLELARKTKDATEGLAVYEGQLHHKA